MTLEKRRHIRIDSQNLLFVCIGDNNAPVCQSMGKTLNISESGILLETHFQIDLHQRVWITIAVTDNLMDLEGKVVHTKEGTGDNFEAGIQFRDLNDSDLKLLREFIALFGEEKKGPP